MITAYFLYTGPDGHSHVTKGSIRNGALLAADSVLFQETPAHSSLDWHNDPIPQYVLTMSGTLEFKVHSGETFVVRPGEVLVATDHTGSGHQWRLIDDQPWRRVYVVYKTGADTQFVADV